MYSNAFKASEEAFPVPNLYARPMSAPPRPVASVNHMSGPMMVMTPYGNYILMQTSSSGAPQMIPITGTVPLQAPLHHTSYITGYATTSTAVQQHAPPTLSGPGMGPSSSERSVQNSQTPYSTPGYAANPDLICSTHRRNPNRARCMCSECQSKSAPPSRPDRTPSSPGPQSVDPLPPKEADIAGSYYIMGGEIIFEPPLDLAKIAPDLGASPRKVPVTNIDEGVQTPDNWWETITATSQTPCAWDGGPSVNPNEALMYCAGSCPTSGDLGMKKKYRKKWCCHECKSERKKEKELKKKELKLAETTPPVTEKPEGIPDA